MKVTNFIIDKNIIEKKNFIDSKVHFDMIVL